MRRVQASLVGVIVLALLGDGGAKMAQTNDPEPARVEARLRLYDERVRALDSRGIAELFDPDGEIQHEGQTPTRGRAAIEALFASFSGYQILENSTAPASTVVQNDTAVQAGSYHQKVKTPAGKVVEVSGSFRADWLKDGSGEWLIKRLWTKS